MKIHSFKLFFFSFLIIILHNWLMIQPDALLASDRSLLIYEDPVDVTAQYSDKIPYVLHLTYKDYNYVPDKVWDQLSLFAPEYEIKFYDDQECRTFLETYFRPEVLRRYNSLSSGAHRADLFRYCLLYVYGGVYFDIKIKPEVYLNSVFDHGKSKMLYTVLSSCPGNIFQGIIATYPKNELFLDLIEHMLKTSKKKANENYIIFTQYFYSLLADIAGRPLIPGEFYLNSNLGSIVLFQEINKQVNQEQTDRYHGFYGIYRNEFEETRLFKTRYSDYPWKKKKKG